MLSNRFFFARGTARKTPKKVFCAVIRPLIITTHSSSSSSRYLPSSFYVVPFFDLLVACFLLSQ